MPPLSFVVEIVGEHSRMRSPGASSMFVVYLDGDEKNACGQCPASEREIYHGVSGQRPFDCR